MALGLATFYIRLLRGPHSGQTITENDVLAVYTAADKLASDNIAGTLPLITSYFDLQPISSIKKALIASTAGIVSLEPTGTEGVAITIDGIPHGVVDDTPIFVHDGQCVQLGTQLSYGEIDVKKLYNSTKNLALAAQVFVERVWRLYREEGIDIVSTHIETIFRSMTEITEIDSKLRRFDDGVSKLLGVKGLTQGTVR